MTVFVDILKSYPKNVIKASAKKYGNSWCHMWCDGDEEELHKIAAEIGLKRCYFQVSSIIKHYDLVPSKRKKAIEAGAVEMSLKSWIRDKISKKS